MELLSCRTRSIEYGLRVLQVSFCLSFFLGGGGCELPFGWFQVLAPNFEGNPYLPFCWSRRVFILGSYSQIHQKLPSGRGAPFWNPHVVPKGGVKRTTISSTPHGQTGKCWPSAGGGEQGASGGRGASDRIAVDLLPVDPF